jgi:serine/threonine protein kinase
MPLPSGSRLGAYEIVSLLGAGGMGEVYRARDTRLDRTVALKILPPSLASDPQFRERFIREGRAISQLDHPHICTLYDVGEQDGTSFLVMQYLEGETLESRLKKGGLPLDQALQLAIEIADALDKAHRAGIVHRDLKPGNIMLTKSGAMLLDFGLAKTTAVGAAAGLSMLPTTPPGLTAQGTILGTFQYMAPEQLEGKEADARTDIFAFGSVLYEMVTGRKAFEGKSQASLIAAILERPAPSAAPVAPSSLDRLIKRCLAKDPEERWQSVRDIMAALDLIGEAAIPLQTPLSTPRKTAPWPWLVAGATGVALAVLSFVHFRETQPEPRVVRFQIPAPENTRISSAPTLSPDGRYVAFIVRSTDLASRIWVRQLDTLETRALPGTENATENIFWSPDSRFIAFSADQRLKAIEVSGTGLRTVCDVGGNIGGGSWSADGVIIFASFARGLLRVPASGGTPTPLATPSGNEVSLVLPSFLPDGQRFLYVALQRDRTNPAYVSTIDGSRRTRLPVEGRTRPFFVPRREGERYSHLIYNRGERLVSQAVDEQFAAIGDAEVVVDSLGDANLGGGPGAPGLYSVSTNGILAYLTGATVGQTQLTWFDRGGKTLGTVGPPAAYNDLSLSPDDTQVAVTRGQTPNEDIWLIDLSRNVSSKFTSDPAQDWHPVWAPNGSRVAFSSTRTQGGRTNSLFWKDARNVGDEELLYDSGANERLDDWSPDGKLLLINRTEGRDTLWILPVEPDTTSKERKPTLYLPQSKGAASVSRGQFFPVTDPNGRSWIAYTSNETGRTEIYVESYPPGALKRTISTNGGMQPRWRRDGKELFYISDDQALMAVDVTVGSTLSFGAPRELFQTHLSMKGTLVYRMLRYDATRDGKRFLINTELESSQAAAPPVIVVVNWMAALKK